MHGQGQIGKQLRLRVAGRIGFKVATNSFEAQAECEFLVPITQCAEELLHFRGALPGQPNRAQSRRQPDFIFLHRLEQGAFEIATTGRTFRVNSAAIASAKSRARLGYFGHGRVFSRTSLSQTNFYRKAHGTQPACIIARLKFDVPKQHAVAAKSALETKLPCHCFAGNHVLPAKHSLGKIRSATARIQL